MPVTIRNFRDIGGIETKYGKIKKNRLLRGTPLNHISEADQHYLLDDLKLRQIIDFRSDRECEHEPDIMLKGVHYTQLDIMEGIKQVSADPAKMLEQVKNQDSVQYMNGLYETFVSSKECAKKFREFIDIAICNQEGSLYFHCTAGKDRTGFGAAMLLKLLGASDQQVLEDYLLTNVLLTGYNDHLTKKILDTYNLPSFYAANIESMLGVKKEYLETSLQTIHEHYGDMQTYRKEGLQISDEDIDKLKVNYLE